MELSVEDAGVEGYKSFAVQVDNTFINYGLVKVEALQEILQDIHGQLQKLLDEHRQVML